MYHLSMGACSLIGIMIQYTGCAATLQILQTQITLPHRHRLSDRATETKKDGIIRLFEVEVAITEPNLHISLIVLLFQNVV